MTQASTEEIDSTNKELVSTTDSSSDDVWEKLPVIWRPLYTGIARWSYDPERYDFVTPIREMLCCPDDVPLWRLHEVQRPEGFQPCPALRKGMLLAGMSAPREGSRLREGKSQAQNKRDWARSPAYQQFKETYRRFLKEVILPTVATAADDRDGVLLPDVVQMMPVLRVVMPSTHYATKVHRDGDYGHIAQELNYWVPLSPVFGSNSLYTESFPDRGDYEAFEGDTGDVFRWWGNRCRHYAEPNSTTSTRVSFDFRVVPGPLWIGAEAVGEVSTAAEGRTLKHLGELRLGSYYDHETASARPSSPSAQPAVQSLPLG